MSKRFFFFVMIAFLSLSADKAFSQQQDSSNGKPRKTKNWVLSDLTKRSNDHFVFDFGYEYWWNAPRSFRLQGFHHFVGFNFFYDLPFRGNQHFSFAPGIGISLHRVYFENVSPSLTASQLDFVDVTNAEHADVHALFYNNFELQSELRYISNPQRSERSFKVALGIKLGVTFDAINYRVNRNDATGNRLATGVFEEHSATFFQFPSVEFTLRVGYGVAGLVIGYQVTDLFTSASKAPQINPLRLGVVLSGF